MEPGPIEGQPAHRLEEFESEVRRMGVKGGNSEPERWLAWAGAALAVVGAILAVTGWITSNRANNTLDQNDSIVMALTGLLSALVGVVLWARYSLSRYFRYWLVRVIYEDRLQADRIVDALARIEQRLAAGDRPAPTKSGV